MIWSATKTEMAGRFLEESAGGGGASDDMPAVAAAASGNNADGIDKAAFVSLMVKVHFLIIHPPVRLDYLGPFIFQISLMFS